MTITKKGKNGTGNVIRAKGFRILAKTEIVKLFDNVVNRPIGVIRHEKWKDNVPVYAVKKWGDCRGGEWRIHGEWGSLEKCRVEFGCGKDGERWKEWEVQRKSMGTMSKGWIKMGYDSLVFGWEDSPHYMMILGFVLC
jgi:hypothetical protein